MFCNRKRKYCVSALLIKIEYKRDHVDENRRLKSGIIKARSKDEAIGIFVGDNRGDYMIDLVTVVEV